MRSHFGPPSLDRTRKLTIDGLVKRPLTLSIDDLKSFLGAAFPHHNGQPIIGATVVIDGEPVGRLASGGEMEVSFHHAMGTLAQLPGSTFYRRIREKFGRLAH